MADLEIVKSRPFYKKSLFLAFLFFGVLFVVHLAFIGYLVYYRVLTRELAEKARMEQDILADKIAHEAIEMWEEQNWNEFKRVIKEFDVLQYVNGKLAARGKLFKEEIHDGQGNVKATRILSQSGRFLPKVDNLDIVLINRMEEPIGAQFWREKRPVIPVYADQGLIEKHFIKARNELILNFAPAAIVSLGILSAAFLYVLRLIRKSRRLEAEAQIADRLAYVGSLASGLAHEIRNPLNAMAVNLQMLEEEIETTCPGNEGEVRSMVSGAMGEIQRLNLLVTQFLDYARPVDPKFVDTDVNAVVGDTLDFLRGDMDSNRIEVHRELASPINHIPMDPQQIRQAVLNVLLNAKQVLPEGGRIDVSTVVGPRGEVRIGIRDNGPGIPPEECEKIFQIFFSTKGGGTGMGLPIARKILENHGGSIDVKTRTGEGTCFTLILPRIPPGHESRQEKPAAARLAGAGATTER
jgi:signal transduction histidine kinase